MASSIQEDEIVLPAELGTLASCIERKPETLASGDEEIRDAALTAAKYIFDLAVSSEARARPHLKELLESIKPKRGPLTRAQARSANNVERQKPVHISHSILDETPLPSLLVDGMGGEQIWAQLDLKAKNVCETLNEVFDAGDMDARGTKGASDSEDDEEEDESDSEELENLQNMGELDEEGWKLDDSDDGEGEEVIEDEASDEENILDEEEGLEETIAELRDPSSEEDTSDEAKSIDLDVPPPSRQKLSRGRNRKKHKELDDGFFSLADFNAEIEEAEAKTVSHGSLSKGSDDEDSGDDNELDLFTPMDNATHLGDNDNKDGRDAHYKDFFDIPPKLTVPAKRKAPGPVSASERGSKVHFNEQVKVKKIKVEGKGRPLSSVDLRTGEEIHIDGEEDGDLNEEHDSEDDNPTYGMSEDSESTEGSGSENEWEDTLHGRAAVERLKDDLFADDDEDSSPKSGLSTHEARMEAIRKQIAELEAENVGEKDWMLKGEVSSKTRPQNALLEEDLEFEHVSKAVPVVTDEAVNDLEARIKSRIVEGRFDDVIRKRPLDDKPFLPSRVFELQDTKSKESLAQIYENEYMAAQSGVTTDVRDAKLQKEHEEIEKQWESICYKLDALCNAHFTPKQPKATISTVPNIPAVSLESPLPTSKTASTVLAPEEIYAPTASDLRSKSELTPAEKQAQWQKERKKRKKQRELLDKGVDRFAKSKGIKSVRKQKEEALKSVVKTGKGVTVIGKKSQSLNKGKR